MPLIIKMNDLYYESPDKNYKKSNNYYSNNFSRQRRRRCDDVGRDFKCDVCKLAYLSSAALYTHKKLKHGLDCGAPSRRSSGRPERIHDAYYGANSEVDMIEIIEDLHNYFSSLPEELSPLMGDHLLDEDFIDELQYCMRSQANANANSTIVEVVSRYFKETKGYLTTKESFSLLKVFVLLIDCANEEMADVSKSYCTYFSADDFPAFFNVFLNNYLGRSQQYFDLEKDYVIKHLSNLSKWLFRNDFSSMFLKQI